MTTLSRISQPPQDAISALRFAPEHHTSAGDPKLLVSSWDKRVYVYSAASHNCLLKHESTGPILDCGWLDWRHVVFGTLDSGLEIIDVGTGRRVSRNEKIHDGCVRKINPVDHNTFVTGGWDRKLKMWDARTMKNTSTAFIGAKIFCQSVTPSSSSQTLCVVGGSDKRLHIFDYRMSGKDNTNNSASAFSKLQNNASNSNNRFGLQKLESRESTLKFQLRALACSPNGQSFVHGSVEGRACWDYFDQATSATKRFAFKCHRILPTANGTGAEKMEQVHSVNDIAFHPIYGTFATVGGDGCLCMWDGSVKKRIWRTSKFDNSISAVNFSADGKYLAMGVSDIQGDGPREIWVKLLQEHEAASRKKAQ